MNRILLITRPKHDPGTHYLFYWAKEIINLAIKKGDQVLDLKQKRVNKKEISSIISKKAPRFIFFNGHGGADFICGHDDAVLIKVGLNEDLLKSAIVYALSCSSAKELGPKSIKAGALSYIGYDADFMFICDNTKITRPLEDNTAKLFLSPSNHLIRCLLKGHTIEDSCKQSKEKFRENIRKSSVNRSYTYLVPFLYWDMIHLTFFGKRDITF